MNEGKIWLFTKIDNIKNKDTGLVLFLKWCYSVGKISWIHALISAASGIWIPIFYEAQQYAYMSIAIVIAVVDIFYAYFCNEYQKRLFLNRKFTSELLEEFSSLVKSLSIFVEQDVDWKNKIFRVTSEMVCEKLYSIFRDVFKCEIRSSVEYTYKKVSQTRKTEKHVKMVARKSRHRSKPKKEVPLERRRKYFSYRVFTNNNEGINVLEEDEIQDPSIWYTNPNNSVDVKRYIGIAVSVFDNSEVNFILQIDFLDDFTFGENDSEEDIKNFVDKYLLSYVNVVTLSYLLNFNRRHD